MKRLSPLMMLVIGLIVGLSVGALITGAKGDDTKFNYDQVIGSAGETKITRGKLAEACIARVAGQVAPELQEQAVVDEALRTSGIVVTDADVQARVEELKRYAGDNELARQMLEAYPQNVLRDKFRTILMLEKALKITVNPNEARDFFTSNPNLFFSKSMAKLVCIVTDTLADAHRACQRLKDGEDPGKLSVLLSTNPKIREARGEVGYQTRERVNNQLLAEAIFDANEGKGLKPGQFTEPILIKSDDLTADGPRHVEEYWVAYVADFREGKTPRFEDVQAEATLLARGMKLQKAMPLWVRQQWQNIPVKWVKRYDDPVSDMLAITPPPPSRPAN